MRKNLKKRVLYPFVGLATFIFVFVMFFVNSPNAYADTSYTYSVGDIYFKTASTDGNFTVSKKNDEGTSSPEGIKDITWVMSANSSLSFTFAPTNKIITSVSTFSFYGEYYIGDSSDKEAKQVTYSYSFGSYTSMPTTTKSEYTFSIDQDQLNAQKPGSITFTITVNESVRLKAVGSFTFNAKDANVDVNFDTQGGTGGTSTIKATPGSAMPSITLPTKTGYTFDGYYTGTNGGGTKYYNADGTSANNCPSTGLTLYAKWVANKYTVTFDKQNGTSGTNSVTATYNSAMPSATMPTRTGYTFGGYYTGTNGSGTQYYNANGGSAKNWDKTSNTTLYAKWTANTYTVTFDKQNGTGGSNSVTATYDSAMPSAEMPTRIGYTFAGYYDNTSGGTQYYTATGASAKNWDKAAATTLYARWTFNPDELIGLINDIGDVNYPNSRESLFRAEDAYNGLEAIDKTEFQTTYSDDYETLTDARTEYDAQKAVKVQEVIDAINAIGTVTYPNTTVKEALLNAEELYDELAPEEQNSTTITNYPTLTDARTEYNTQRTSKVNEVIAAIDAISEPFDENRETQITNARTLFNALDLDEQNDTWVTNLADLTNAEAADTVADMIEALTPADTQEYRDAVSAARTAYTNLTDAQKSYISVSILQELVDNETAITVMDKINDIGNVQYTNASKALINDANQAYEALTENQKELVVNYSTLTQANTDYDKVDESVYKVNLIKYDSNGDLIFDDENKTLIYDAKDTYDLLTNYQKEIYPEDILQKLLDALAVYNTLDKIDKIGDVSYTDGYINQVTDATNAYNDLTNSQKELISDLALKDLNDNETVLDTLKQIHDIDNSTTPSEYKEKVEDARDVYENLTEDQKTLIGDNLKDLTDREKTNEVVQNIDAIKDENSLEYSDSNKKTITDARESYENLTADQKKNLPSKILKILTDDETIIVVLDKIYEIGEVSYNTESEDKIAEAREAYDSLSEDQKKLVDTKDYSTLTTKEEEFDSTTTTAIVWGIILIILSSIALCTGIFFIIFLLYKKDDDDENDNIQKPKAQKATATVLPLVILSSYFASGPYLAFYIIASLAVAVWIAVLVIYILKKKKDSPVMETSIGTEVETTVDDTNDLEEDVTGEDNDVTEENNTNDEVNEDGEEVITKTDSDGNIFQIRYIKSFTAKLSQSSDELKEYYNVLKNYVLSYKGTTSRISWHFDSINMGRTQILKFAIRGKFLRIYYNLNPEDLDSKYKVEEAKGKKFEGVKVLYRIKNDRRFNYAKELIDIIMNKNNILKQDEQNIDYRIPYESIEVLLSKGLVKENKTLIDNRAHIHKVSVEEADKMMSDENAEASIEIDTVTKKHEGSKEIINIDTLSENYNDGDTVTLESLIEKKLVPSKTGYVKVLARGVLDKQLIVDLDDYSLQAVKMIVLLGGHAKKIK